uniref:Small ribosomal subunit protein uS7 domain-containing protein n=1 Tax=Norrisiella sphaerica TaxID=552664 RepID=A0A6T9YN68_9EUKA|mmetsp:Transcript_916/g.1353  ORF Transcript_916/g.1353 Transcript_916/m.1353 type:complete len:208 (+) Transcript_916:49-672(+)
MLSKIKIKKLHSIKNKPKIMKLFNKWDISSIKNLDLSLSPYIFLDKQYGDISSHSSGNYDKRVFKKSYCPIVERLVCSMMMKNKSTGKKIKAITVVKEAFDLIFISTGLNPIQVLVLAISNSAPVEDTVTLSLKKSSKKEAADLSPYRRVCQGIYFIVCGVKRASIKNHKSVSECLHDEIINAFRCSTTSYAIRKKNEIEKVAASNR